MAGQNFFLLISRIPPKYMLVLVSALALGAGAMVHNQVQTNNERLAEAENKARHREMSSLVVASREIPEGSTITADALQVQTVESGKIPLGALTNGNEAVGLQLRTSVHAGEPLLSQSLRSPERPQGFEEKIKPGYRAITFPVDASTGVAGFLTPDCRVDILAQIGGGMEAKTIPILSDVHVVAVGQTYKKVQGQDEAQPASSVTVEVQPIDGGKLINAMAAGKLYCLMRNQQDHSPLAVRDISSSISKIKSTPQEPSELTALPKAPDPAPVLPPLQIPATEEQRLHNIELWSASKKDQQTVPKE